MGMRLNLGNHPPPGGHPQKPYPLEKRSNVPTRTIPLEIVIFFALIPEKFQDLKDPLGCVC